MLSCDDIAYTAGIIDGEGYIGIIKRDKALSGGRITYDLRINVTMCNPLIPSWLYANFGGRYYDFQPPSLNRKHLYEWRLEASNAGEFLKLILPYLKMKRGEAEIAIEFQDTRRVKYCRRKGKPNILVEAETILHKKLGELHERQYSDYKLGA